MSGFCLLFFPPFFGFVSLFFVFLVTCVSGTELHFCFSLLSLTTILLPLGHEGTLFFLLPSPCFLFGVVPVECLGDSLSSLANGVF